MAEVAPLVREVKGEAAYWKSKWQQEWERAEALRAELMRFGLKKQEVEDDELHLHLPPS